MKAKIFSGCHTGRMEKNTDGQTTSIFHFHCSLEKQRENKCMPLDTREGRPEQCHLEAMRLRENVPFILQAKQYHNCGIEATSPLDHGIVCVKLLYPCFTVNMPINSDVYLSIYFC